MYKNDNTFTENVYGLVMQYDQAILRLLHLERK